MQSGEQGSRFDVERAASDLLDATCDAYAVVWLKQECTQDQQIERSLQQIGLRRIATLLLQIFCMRVLDYLQNVNRKVTARPPAAGSVTKGRRSASW